MIVKALRAQIDQLLQDKASLTTVAQEQERTIQKMRSQLATARSDLTITRRRLRNSRVRDDDDDD